MGCGQAVAGKCVELSVQGEQRRVSSQLHVPATLSNATHLTGGVSTRTSVGRLEKR